MSRRRPREAPAPRRAVAAMLAASLCAGCATHADDPAQPKAARDHAMSPYVIHEECLHAAAGERIEYHFTSTQPVNFNIHYHEPRSVVSPVVRDHSRGDSGVFVAPIEQDYCLMWEAGPAGASLDYRVRLRPLAPSG